MSPTIATLRSLSADLYPLPDRLRLLPQPPLTVRPASGNLSFPKVEGVAVAFAVPHTVKRAVLLILATSAPHGRGYILARRRPDVRETQAASTAGERRLASFFVTATNSQQ